MTDPRQWPPRYWLALTVLPIAVAIIVLGYRVDQHRNRDIREQAVVEAQVRAQRLDRTVLTELCKTQVIVSGLIDAATALFKYEVGILPPKGFRGPNPPLREPLINPKLIPAYLTALNTFLGWQVQLDQTDACERIVNP